MNSFLTITLIFMFASGSIAKPDTSNLLTTTLPGHWHEDQYQRTNFKEFLLEMGKNWFARLYATTASWENEQNINVYSGIFHIDGKMGPSATPFKFTLVPDGKTLSEVDLGALGGPTDATAEIRGNQLITYLTKKGGTEVFMTATRTIHPENPDLMLYEMKHLKSDVAWTSLYNRVTDDRVTRRHAEENGEPEELDGIFLDSTNRTNLESYFLILSRILESFNEEEEDDVTLGRDGLGRDLEMVWYDD